MSNDVLTEVRFWAQVTGDAHRLVICGPDLESRIKGWVDARGLGGIIMVTVNRFMPPERIFIIDEQALEAANRKALNRPIRLR